MNERDLFVSPEEVRRLAGGKKYRPAQRRALQRRKIPFIETDGEIMVLRAVAEQKGGLRAPAEAEAGPGPDFSIFPKVS